MLNCLSDDKDKDDNVLEVRVSATFLFIETYVSKLDFQCTVDLCYSVGPSCCFATARLVC